MDFLNFKGSILLKYMSFVPVQEGVPIQKRRHKPFQAFTPKGRRILYEKRTYGSEKVGAVFSWRRFIPIDEREFLLGLLVKRKS